MEIEGRTAFVTGGASGIGLGIARKLIDAGAKVAIADIRQKMGPEPTAVSDAAWWERIWKK